MAHYAFLDENNIVTEVIVGKDENQDGVDWEQHYGAFRDQVCKRTSYNTRGGVHSNGGTPYRKNYAGLGFTYDDQRDAFIPPQPYPSWPLDEQSCLWVPPVERPDDGRPYDWDEATQQWVLFTPPQPYPSWRFDTDLHSWLPPVPYPEDGGEYQWEEPTTSWVPQ